MVRSTYQKSLKDPELLQLRDEIAALDARSDELMKRIGTAESGATWKATQKAIAEFDKAVRSKDLDAIAQALADLRKLAEQGCGEESQWAEIQRVFKLRKELCEAENKRLLQLKQFLSMERAIALMFALSTAVTEEVEDSQTRERIGGKFRQIMQADPINSQVAARAERMEAHYQQQIEGSGLF